MAEAWTWTYLDSSGSPVTGPNLPTTPFPTQADAEAWFGQEWSLLAEDGVAAVILMRDGETVYGPMPLEEG